MKTIYLFTAIGLLGASLTTPVSAMTAEEYRKTDMYQREYITTTYAVNRCLVQNGRLSIAQSKQLIEQQFSKRNISNSVRANFVVSQNFEPAVGLMGAVLRANCLPDASKIRANSFKTSLTKYIK